MAHEIINVLPSGPMDTLFVWVGVSRDGDEGLLFGPGATPSGFGEVPIICVNNMEHAERARVMADKAITDYAKEGVFLELKLATFVRQKP